MTSAREIVARIDDLPPLSATVTRLQALLSKNSSGDSCSAADLEQVVLYDPAITANLLRMANSVYYRGRQPVTSARTAIVRLGTNGLFEIAMGQSLRKVLPEILPGYDISSAAFMRHGVAVGVLCERLARETRSVDRDLAFTMGLLHDIGKLVLGLHLAQKRDRTVAFLANPTASFEEMEREVLGTDHCAVGLEIARRWRLPETIGVAARWHHAPHDAPDATARQIASVVHVADALAHVLGHGADAGGMRRRVDETVIAELGLEEATIERLAGETLDSIDELALALHPVQDPPTERVA